MISINHLLALIIIYLGYYLIKFYRKRSKLPPGPIPLPLIGNLFNLNPRQHWTTALGKMRHKHGPIFTLWIWNKPFIFVCDLKIAQDIFSKPNFAGRHESYFGRALAVGDVLGTAFADYGPSWESQRKATYLALQELLLKPSLSILINNAVDKTFKMILENEGLNKPFVPFKYIHHIFINITAINAFGRSYDIGDEDYNKIKFIVDDFKECLGIKAIIWEFSPIFRLFDRKLVKIYNKKFRESAELILNNFLNHYQDYDQNDIRDVCDELINIKNNAERAGKKSAQYLTDNSLSSAVITMFMAGTETPQNAFKWFLLYLLRFPDIENRLRNEIERQIGDRFPTNEDRIHCHYVMAFISETIRHSNLAFTTTQHKPMPNSKINQYQVPEDAHVFLCMGPIGNDERYWTNPRHFSVERFLENGQYVSTKPKAYVPFGVGLRMCPAEKLAYTNLFIVLVRFLQKTSDYKLQLYSDGGLDADPNLMTTVEPKKYQIILKI